MFNEKIKKALIRVVQVAIISILAIITEHVADFGSTDVTPIAPSTPVTVTK